MKYIIEIENTPFGNPERDLKLYKCTQFNSLVFDAEGLSRLTPYTEPDRKAIEDEVWEFIRKIYELNYTDWNKIFDFPLFTEVLYHHSYQETKEQYEAWKQETDQKIALWDEVIDEEEDRLKGIVVFILGDTIDILYEDGSVCSDRYIKDFTKTGRRFPQVAEMLKAMKGAE